MMNMVKGLAGPTMWIIIFLFLAVIFVMVIVGFTSGPGGLLEKATDWAVDTITKIWNVLNPLR